MLELTFLVGENRTRMTNRQLTHPSVFNELIKYIKLPRECSRRIRELDFAVLKAQEMRNIILFLFPVIVQCLEPEAKERRLWLLLAFMLRSCTIPESEFGNVNIAEIKNSCKQFYSLFEKLFSSKNCTYNVHIIAAHLLDIRSQGPLTETSAFIFENFYGEMRKSFVPGTTSPIKQIMQRIYLKRSLSYHCCQKTIFYSAKDTDLESNSIVYVYENNQYKMYKIFKIEKENPDVFFCYVQGNIEIEFQETPDCDWGKVGVFKEGATGNDVVIINRESVRGKVIKVCSLLITCPLNVLNEK